jgi:hypothetical protein
MKKLISTAPALCAVLIFGACSTAQHSAAGGAARARPDWVDGTSAAYPVQSDLIGVGSAQALEEAEDKARGQIADFFLLQVTVKSKDTSSESLRSQGSKKVDLLFQDVSQQVETNSTADIEGVEIPDTWKDPSTGRYYALAVLDRQKAAQTIAARIADLDRQIGELKNELGQSQGRFAQAKAAMSLLSNLESRGRLDSRLEVLTGQGISSSEDEIALRRSAQKSLSALSVSVLTRGDDSGRLQAGIVRGLGALGLELAASTAPADIAIEASATTQLLSLNDIPFLRALSSASVVLKRDGSQEIFAQFNSSAYGNGGAAQDAEDKSLAALSDAVAKQLQENLVKYFGGL